MADDFDHTALPQLRAALGLTQTQLAEACGVKLRVVQYWEAGERQPGGAARKILEGLRVKAERRQAKERG